MPGIDKRIDFFIHVYFLSAIKYVYKIINQMYFILYQVLLFYFISSYYTAVLCVSKVSFLVGIDKELSF